MAIEIIRVPNQYDGVDFNDALVKFDNGIRDAKALTRYLAESAAIHLIEKGDCNLLNAVLHRFEGEGKNFVRKQAYLTWLRDFFPLTMTKGVIVRKQDGGVNVAFDESLVKLAFAKAFFDYDPEKDKKVFFTAGDLLKQLLSVVSRMEKLTPKDDAAKAMLGQAGIAVATLKAAA